MLHYARDTQINDHSCFLYQNITEHHFYLSTYLVMPDMVPL